MDPTKYRETGNDQVYPSPPSSPRQTAEASKQYPHGKTLPKAKRNPLGSLGSQGCVLEAEGTQQQDGHCKTLQDRLQVNGGLCGAMTKNDKPCRWRKVRNSERIESLIDSMANLTCASLELDEKLDELIRLIHCRHHDHGRSKEARLEQWRAQFPNPKSALFPPAEGLEKRVRQLLELKSAQCNACEREIGGQKVHNCARTVNELVKPKVFFSSTNLDYLLQVLAYNIHCQRHAEAEFAGKAVLWKSQLREICGTFHSDDFDAPSAHVQLLDLTKEPSAFWPAAYDISAFEIIDRENSLESSKDTDSCSKGLKATLMQPLDPTETHLGFVYVYEVAGNDGFVKIGYTTKSVEERLAQWTFHCNRSSKSLYPNCLSSAKMVPYPKRIEALCHAELDYCRSRIYCRNCLKEHLEWFQITPTNAIAVVEKWSRWMTTEPYVERRFRNNPKFFLKTEELQKTRKMEKFMKNLAEIPVVRQ